jgi:hypothetical protein
VRSAPILYRQKPSNILTFAAPTAFDWDKGNREKRTRHGVSLAEIEALLRGNPRVAPDLAHAALEGRHIAVGRNQLGRPMFVAFTRRRQQGRILLRPITARYMHTREIQAYEAQSPQAED